MGWVVGFGGEDGADDGALVVGELAAKGWGIDGLLALLGGKLAEIHDGVKNDVPTRHGNGTQLLHGDAPLLLLRRSQVLQRLVAVEHSGALLRIHVIEPDQFLAITLLRLRRQLVKAGLGIKRA